MRTTAGRVFGLGVAVLLLTGYHLPSVQAANGDDTPWLGVFSQGLTSELRDGLEYEGDGVLVNRVVSGSPADQAGLKKGDVIVRVGLRSVDSPEALIQAVRASRVGQRVAVHIVRDGKREALYARLASRSEATEDPENSTDPEAEESAPEPPQLEDLNPEDVPHLDKDKDVTIEIPEGGFSMMGMGRGRLGIRIESLNSDLGDYFGVEDGKGVLVVEVLKDTPAARAGLKPGDVITQIDDHSVSDSDDLVRTLRSREGKVAITVVRRGSRRTVEAELGEAPRTLRLRRGDGLMRTPRSPRPTDRMQWRGFESPDRDELQRELKELREELKELRKEMEELRR